MAYDKFNTLTSTAVPLPIENVDTDQIIPARFLKATKREGFGDGSLRMEVEFRIAKRVHAQNTNRVVVFCQVPSCQDYHQSRLSASGQASKKN